MLDAARPGMAGGDHSRAFLAKSIKSFKPGTGSRP